MDASVLSPFNRLPGKIGFYYHNLETQETLSMAADLPLIAASVIKLPIMVEAFNQAEQGLLDLMEPVKVERKDCLPSCGALSYLHEGVTLPWIDLVTLMIIVSDNTATNLLIERLGIDCINATMAHLGLTASRLNRKLFRPELSRQGIENRVTARDMGILLEKIYKGEVVSPQASARMLEILSHQQLNGKMPFHLHGRGIKCAHKTGEDTGITHDVGIVYGPQPFVVCYLSNEVEVTDFEHLIHETTLTLLNATERNLKK
ncbi:MAG: serine hydrolase [Clostridia bacterium]|nr:serine hydrolase [Clostridia bacterium]